MFSWNFLKIHLLYILIFVQQHDIYLWILLPKIFSAIVGATVVAGDWVLINYCIQLVNNCTFVYTCVATKNQNDLWNLQLDMRWICWTAFSLLEKRNKLKWQHAGWSCSIWWILMMIASAFTFYLYHPVWIHAYYSHCSFSTCTSQSMKGTK